MKIVFRVFLLLFGGAFCGFIGFSRARYIWHNSLEVSYMVGTFFFVLCFIGAAFGWINRKR